jgi:predicted RNA-binding Zn-ribbon protein involved in translation (DUF1610 family)
MKKPTFTKDQHRETLWPIRCPFCGDFEPQRVAMKSRQGTTLACYACDYRWTTIIDLKVKSTPASEEKVAFMQWMQVENIKRPYKPSG